jgi:hypothetical protein
VANIFYTQEHPRTPQNTPETPQKNTPRTPSPKLVTSTNCSVGAGTGAAGEEKNLRGGGGVSDLSLRRHKVRLYRDIFRLFSGLRVQGFQVFNFRAFI